MDERVDPAFTPTNGGRSCRRTPIGTGWQYEPKYDGFRCLAHRRCGRVHLQSKNQKPLERYFSEVAEEIEEIAADDFVFDGGSSLSVAPSRASSCACIPLLDGPLTERRRALEDFMAQAVLRLGRATAGRR